MSELTTEDLQAMKEFCGKSHLPILKELAVQAFDELLSLRTDAGDEEIEDLLDSIPAPELNEKWVKLTGESECLRNDLRSAREEIERLKSECDNHECQHLHYRKLWDDANNKIEDLKSGATQ